jgi:hypothetical protein
MRVRELMAERIFTSSKRGEERKWRSGLLETSKQSTELKNKCRLEIHLCI